MLDRRIALKENNEIWVDSHKKIKIRREIGRGASCIVYDAVYKDRIGVLHEIRVKECYPIYLQVMRDEENALKMGENAERFGAAKEAFVEAYRKNAEIHNTLGLTNSTVDSGDIVYANHTVYIVMMLDEGSDYEKYEDQSLKELLLHMRSVAELLGRYHENGYLHLDIKPENIFVLPETQEHILLFDFDTVVRCDEVQEQGTLLSFSEGFSAPEQVQGRRSKIGTHTDIYSIGAVLYYKIFGRKAEIKNLMFECPYHFEEMNFFDERYQPKFFRKMETFFQNTLSISTVCRWKEMCQVLEALDELILLADVEGVYLKDNFTYHSACFVGREEELREIEDVLNKNQLVFLSGIGGIGKTELAKYYAKKHRSRYDTVVFATFQERVQTLINEEVELTNIYQEENETNEAFFERKIEILKKIVTSKDLIVIDNFDVEYDEDMELLFSCPCKFMITTREDFHDFNYPQIEIYPLRDPDEVLQLFYHYNDILYEPEECEAVKDCIRFVDYHTMTVELIAKYLRNTESSPKDLIEKFREKEGIVNTDERKVKQRKDTKLNIGSVNCHLRILFDLSKFTKMEKELLGSLSLFAGIHIKQDFFEELFCVGNAKELVERLIRHGWIQCNKNNEKIWLHQIIQDLVYQDFAPTAEHCPHIVDGMILYHKTKSKNYFEKKIKKRVLKIFMERLHGNTSSYIDLCLMYGKKEKLKEAESICKNAEFVEKYDLLQKIYRKLFWIEAKTDDMFAEDWDLGTYGKKKCEHLWDYFQKAQKSCFSYRTDANYLVRELVKMCEEMDKALEELCWTVDTDAISNELNVIYQRMISIYDIATEKMQKTNYSAMEKRKLYQIMQTFYQSDNFYGMYRCEHFADMEKAYEYQKRINDTKEEEVFFVEDVTEMDLAYEYEMKMEYEKAIACWEAYGRKDEISFEIAVSKIVELYQKMGNTKKAIEYFEAFLQGNKNNQADDYMTMISLLLCENRKHEAQYYIKELIVLCEEKNDIPYLVAGYHAWYRMAEDKEEKERLWNICLDYYGQMDEMNFEKILLNFLYDYTDQLEESWKKMEDRTEPDRYLQSMLYDKIAQYIDYDSEEAEEKILYYKKKCDYRLIANYHVKKVNTREEKAEIWKEAATKYSEIELEEEALFCMEQALNDCVPQKENKGYEILMTSCIRAYIAGNKKEEAYKKIEEFLINMTEFWKEKQEIQVFFDITGFLKIIEKKKEALLVCVCEWYLLLMEEIDISLINRMDILESNWRVLCHRISKNIEDGILTEAVDAVLEICEDIRELCLEVKQEEFTEIIELADQLEGKYRYQTIEFWDK